MPKIPITKPLAALGVAFEMDATHRGVHLSNVLVFEDGRLSDCTSGSFDGAVLYKCGVRASQHTRALLVDPQILSGEPRDIIEHITRTPNLLTRVLQWAAALTDGDRVDLAGCTLNDVRFAALDGYVLRGDLRNIDLSRTTMTSQLDTWATVRTATNVSFAHASLSGIVFHRWSFHDVDFHGADLSHAAFIECRFERTSFYGANLAGASFVRCSTINEPVDLTSASVEHLAVFRGDGLRFFSMTMTPEQLKHAFVSDMRVPGQDLQPFATRIIEHFAHAGRITTELEGLDLRGVDLKDLTFYDVSFRGCKLSGARMNDVTFLRCNLTDAQLDSVSARAIYFSGCELVNLDLSNSVVKGQVCLELCVVRNTTFDGMVAYGITLESSSFTDVSFRGIRARYIELRSRHMLEQRELASLPRTLLTRAPGADNVMLPVSELPPGPAAGVLSLARVDFQDAHVGTIYPWRKHDVVLSDINVGPRPSPGLVALAEAER